MFAPFFSYFHFSISWCQVSTVMLCTWSEHTANSSRGFNQIQKNSSQQWALCWAFLCTHKLWDPRHWLSTFIFSVGHSTLLYHHVLSSGSTLCLWRRLYSRYWCVLIHLPSRQHHWNIKVRNCMNINASSWYDRYHSLCA